MEVFKWIAGTIILALGVGVAFLQFRTAKQKAGLELSDRQFKIYEAVKNCVDQFSRNSQGFGHELKKFRKAMEEARFYFDDDLHDYLSTLLSDIVDVCNIDRYVASMEKQNKQISPTELAKLGPRRDGAMARIQKFYEVGHQKFANSRPRSLGSKLLRFLRPT